MTQPKKTNIAIADHYTWSEICDGWHLVQSENLSVIQERVPPGKSEVRHYHTQARQFFFVLEGEAVIEFGSTNIQLARYDGVEIAPCVPHQFQNLSNKDVIFLIISSPPSHGDRAEL